MSSHGLPHRDCACQQQRLTRSLQRERETRGEIERNGNASTRGHGREGSECAGGDISCWAPINKVSSGRIREPDGDSSRLGNLSGRAGHKRNFPQIVISFPLQEPAGGRPRLVGSDRFGLPSSDREFSRAALSVLLSSPPRRPWNAQPSPCVYCAMPAQKYFLADFVSTLRLCLSFRRQEVDQT